MSEEKKVIEELHDVQETMKRVEQRRMTTKRFPAVRLPKEGTADTPETTDAENDKDPSPR